MSKFEKSHLKVICEILQKPNIVIDFDSPEPEVCKYVVHTTSNEAILEMTCSMEKDKDVFSLQINGELQNWSYKNLKTLYTKICTVHLQKTNAESGKSPKKDITDFLGNFR